MLHDQLSGMPAFAEAPPPRSLVMAENSVVRNFSRVVHLVAAARRLTSSRSTEAGWCLVSCQSHSCIMRQRSEGWIGGYPCRPLAGQAPQAGLGKSADESTQGVWQGRKWL